MQRKNKKDLRVFLFALFTLVCFNPYMLVLVHVPQLHVMGGSLLQLVFLVLYFILVVSVGGTINTKGAVWSCVVIQAIGLMLSFVVHGAGGYFLIGITMLLVLFMISYIDKTIGLRTFFEYYNKWILLMAIGGTALFVMAFIGIPPIADYKNPVSEIDTMSSWIIGFTNTYRSMAGEIFSFVRYSGYFDEPGAMGYWGIYALVFNKLFYDNKKLEIALLILLLFTFSMGYFVQAFAYVFLFYVMKRSKFRLPILIVIALAVTGIYFTKNTEYSDIYKASFGRFERMTETTGSDVMIEDRRGYVTEEAKKVFMQNPIMGVGAKEWAEMPYMADNPYETLARDGIVGTLYWYMPYILLLILGLKRKDNVLLRLFLVLFLGFLHRPFQMTVLAFFVTYSLLYLYEKSYTRRLPSRISSNSSVQ